MILRATFANMSSATAARLAQDAGLQGTIFPSTGFGAWGTEQGITYEFAVIEGEEARKVEAFLCRLLETQHEQAAYLTRDGQEAALLWTGVPAGGACRREEIA